MSRHIPVHVIRLVRRRAKNICEYCLLPQEWQEATFHVDHIEPLSAGGETKAENLALACVSCSLSIRRLPPFWRSGKPRGDE
jgi:hypothetical protein